MGRKAHQWNQNGKEAQNMEDQDEALEKGKSLGSQRVDDDCERQYGPVEEHRLPRLRDVFWFDHDYHGLQQRPY